MSLSYDKYEVKFHAYDGNEQDIDILLERYRSLRDIKKAESGVMAKVLTHFFNGLVALVEADNQFWKNNYPVAYQGYQEAMRLFNNFTISRTVKVALDKYVDRLTHRATGMKLLTEALVNSNLELRDNLLVESMNEFNTEVQLANEEGEQMSSYAAYARASFIQSQLLYYRGMAAPPNKSGSAKKNTLDARDALRQASFIDKRYLSYIEVINDQLDILTRKRLLSKGETFADEATKFMEEGEYNQAIIGFNKASLFYKRASSLASDGSSRRMLLSFSTLYEASIKEAKATEAQKNIELEDASNFFKESIQLVDKAIALLGAFGTDNLVNSFKCQRDYYEGMYKFNLATLEFDVEKYNEAKKYYEEAKKVFNNAIDLAIKVENISIKNLSNEAISEISSYITMCENLA